MPYNIPSKAIAARQMSTATILMAYVLKFRLVFFPVFVFKSKLDILTKHSNLENNRRMSVLC